MPETSNLLRPVFILGCCSRCGSTLLQRLISSSGSIFIWGENNGMVAQLISMRQRLLAWTEFNERQWSGFDECGLRHWIANLNPRDHATYANATRNFLLSYYAPETARLGYERWGFKEVRHGGEVAQFLLECFPDARIIYLLRNPHDVLASNAATDWYAASGYARGIMELWCSNTRDAISNRDPRAIIVRYEELITSTNAVMTSVFAHVDCPPVWDSDLLHTFVRGVNRRPALAEDEFAALACPEVDDLYRAAYPALH